MMTGPGIVIHFYTRADMEAAGDAVLGVVASDRTLAPQRIGPCEPLKIPFPSDEATALWRSEAHARGMLQGERKRPSSIVLTAIFGFSPGCPFHTISWSGRLAGSAASGAAPRIEDLFRRLAVASRAWYGFATNSEEYDRQNVKPTESGSFRVLGLDPHVALPGLYWLNYFGPEYTRFLGADLLGASDPPAEPLDDGMLLKLAPTPEALLSPSAIERTESIKRRIGADLFFDISDPDRTTRAPYVPIPAIQDIAPPPGVQIDIDLPGMPDAARFIATAAERAAAWRRSHGFAVPGQPTFKEARAVLRTVEAELDPGLPEIHPEAVVADATAVLGEMIIARLGGHWQLSGEPTEDGAADVRVITGRGEIVDPMRRILKRTGDRDARLYWWYHALVTETLPPPLRPERVDSGADE